MADKRQVIAALHALGGVAQAATPIYTLASGKKSDFYVDVRKITYAPETISLIGHYIASSIHSLGIKGVGGLTLGADPIAFATMWRTRKAHPLYSYTAFTIRKEVKGHGKGGRIVGNVLPGQRVAIVEDVVATGGSTIEAIKAATAYGLEVVAVRALVDKQEGGLAVIQTYVPDTTAWITKEELVKE